ncbi:MAG: prolyl oligopeptidase family serine peptidase [Pseudomonadota bacterium]|nr:prolyl oligopeptidase family serine peptidase [Pseudomonadota bacterium]
MRFLCFLLLACVLLPARAATVAPPPLEVFFSKAKLQSARISPSGQWLAITAAAGTGRLALAVVDTEGKQAPQITASFSNADVVSFEWVNDDRLVFTVQNLLVGVGEEKFGGIYSIKRDGTQQRQLARGLRYHAERVLSIPKGGGDTVLIGDYEFNLKGEVDSVNADRVNVVDGRRTSLSQDRPEHARAWLFDPAGRPKVIVASNEGKATIFWRESDATPWREIASYPEFEMGFRPLAVDEHGTLYGLVNEGEARTAVLTRFDFATGKPSDEPIVSTPGFDFDGRLLFSKDSTLAGVRLSTDAETTVWLLPAMKKVQATVDNKLRGHVNDVSCADCNSPSIVLVNSYSDQDPGSIWTYRPANDEWHLVGQRRPDIDPSKMARLDLHRIKARDGSELPVWVTMPPGAPPKSPAVLLVHGGPQARGVYWGWNPETQFLASRGYVVIEPEFRGSEGYGTVHLKAGWKHWGDTMQDDNADALAWAVAQGMVDPGRACIAGASYGGYATLMSLIRYPDTYRCGVAWVAVTDPRLLFNEDWASDSQEEGRRYYLPLTVGDPVKDAEMLRRSAPSERAGEIKVPLLLAFGRDDRRVPIEHGFRMRSALTAAGHPPEWIVYDGEGHGWRTLEHQFDFYHRVERFLAEQLKPALPVRAATQ